MHNSTVRDYHISVMKLRRLSKTHIRAHAAARDADSSRASRRLETETMHVSDIPLKPYEVVPCGRPDYCVCGSAHHPSNPTAYYSRKRPPTNNVAEQCLQNNLSLAEGELEFIFGIGMALKEAIKTVCGNFKVRRSNDGCIIITRDGNVVPVTRLALQVLQKQYLMEGVAVENVEIDPYRRARTNLIEWPLANPAIINLASGDYDLCTGGGRHFVKSGLRHLSPVKIRNLKAFLERKVDFHCRNPRSRLPGPGYIISELREQLNDAFLRIEKQEREHQELKRYQARGLEEVIERQDTDAEVLDGDLEVQAEHIKLTGSEFAAVSDEIRNSLIKLSPNTQHDVSGAALVRCKAQSDYKIHPVVSSRSPSVASLSFVRIIPRSYRTYVPPSH